MEFKIFEQPEVEPDCHSNFMILQKDFCFSFDRELYWIPAGYSWDGASIPRAVWWIVGSATQPDLWAASLVHDFIYLTHILTRAQADEAFFQILKQSDVSLWRRRVMWAAVRSCGGFLAWGTRENDKATIRKLWALINQRGSDAVYLFRCRDWVKI